MQWPGGRGWVNTGVRVERTRHIQIFLSKVDRGLVWRFEGNRGDGARDRAAARDTYMHFLPQPSDFVPLKIGFYSFRAQID